MNTTPEMNTARFWSTAARGTWRVYDSRGRVVAFDLTEERARDWAKTIGGAKAVKE